MNVAPAADTDGDGLPDDFEVAFGLNPSSADGHTGLNNDGINTDLDSDGDGASNYEEFLAGTRPNDASSVFRVQIQREPGRTLLFFPTVAGAAYRAEAATVVTGPWEILADDIAGMGSPLRLTDMTSAPIKFYRARTN